MPSGLNNSQYRMACNVSNQCNAFPKFFVISSDKSSLKFVSPIVIYKTITGLIGEVSNIKKLNNGHLLIEVKNKQQSENIAQIKQIGEFQVNVAVHRSLNHSRGVISEREFQRDLEDDILDCLKDQKVIAVRRITIKRNNQILPTKHLILTFNTPTLPKSVKITYINCPVKPYIPDPLRCFKCQKFGHTITACRGDKEICARCSLPDHNSKNCSSTTAKCYNCEGDHPAYFRSCPRYKEEKEIQTVKITKNVSFPEARKIVNDRTPKPGLSYSSALNTTITPSELNTPQNSQRAPKVINSTPAAPVIVDPIADKDTITVKKSDWLALLAIKRSWEETSSPATKKPKRKRDLQKGKIPKPPPKETKIQIDEKEDQLKIHPSEGSSISEMDDDIADSDPSHVSPEHFKSKFFKKPK
ncbi:hypothetical protein AVEN_130959-1 [Araneus ventricosus]|uniref:CCHC-type domain-containing protein n=1 Tax=Araneus ventricosus TaxID=182803 RepID=A0A4Y2RM20_ARAVE|nr:hypothetical protein AVEN_130959-1 [Araneus ventricosus]